MGEGDMNWRGFLNLKIKFGGQKLEKPSPEVLFLIIYPLYFLSIFMEVI